MMSKRLSEAQKYEISKKLSKGISERKLVLEYNTSKGTINRIKRKQQETSQNTVIPENKSLQELNRTTYELFKRFREKNIPVKGQTLKYLGLQVASKMGLDDFKASNGWIMRFKERHQLEFKILSGEEKSADLNAAQDFIKSFEEKINMFDKENVFNVDETALYYRHISNKSFVEKTDACKGIKQNKERITLLLCVSMSGEKLDPLIIGKYKNPRCFKKINPQSFGVQYYWSKKAWMTNEIFSSWILDLNENMKNLKRKILLLSDNATSHKKMELSNIEMIFLPKNTTAFIQPLDMGVIKAFKNHYENCYLESNIVNQNDTLDVFIKKIDMLDVMQYVSEAWKRISSQTIINCFNKALVVDKFSGTIQDTNIEEAINLLVKDEVSEDTEDEVIDTKIEEDKILSVDDFQNIMLTLKTFITENIPEKIIEFYDFKKSLVKSLKLGYQKKITDYY